MGRLSREPENKTKFWPYPDVINPQSTDELLSNGDSTKGSSVSPPHGHLSLQRCTHNGDYIPSNHGDWNIHAGGYHTLGRHESQSHSGVPPISSYISEFNFISCFGACQQYFFHVGTGFPHGGYHILGRHESQSHSGVPPISSYISKFHYTPTPLPTPSQNSEPWNLHEEDFQVIFLTQI